MERHPKVLILKYKADDQLREPSSVWDLWYPNINKLAAQI